MSEYKPKCDVCPHYNSCTMQKTLKMLYEERFNRSRELAGSVIGGYQPAGYSPNEGSSNSNVAIPPRGGSAQQDD